MAARPVDITGKTFGQWTVVAQGKSRRPKRSSIYWTCKCACGVERDVDSFSLRHGISKSCGCWGHKNAGLKKRKDRGVRGLNFLYAKYRYFASKRGFPFNLSKRQFKALTSSECFYCGAAPASVARSGHGSYTYNGVDRLDSHYGYSPKNCVTACRWCNVAKTDRSLKDFCSWVHKADQRLRLCGL